MHIVIQPELIFSLIIMAMLAVFFIYAGRKIALADATKRPKGLVLVVETAVEMIYNYLNNYLPHQILFVVLVELPLFF